MIPFKWDVGTAYVQFGDYISKSSCVSPPGLINDSMSKTLLAFAFMIGHLTVQAQTWTAGGTSTAFDKEYTILETVWSIDRIDEGAAVFIYDHEVMYTLFTFEGVVTLTASTQKMRDDILRSKPLLSPALPFVIGQGTKVRLVCEPGARILISKSR